MRDVACPPCILLFLQMPLCFPLFSLQRDEPVALLKVHVCVCVLGELEGVIGTVSL